jgi:hypothetical protein
MYPAHVPKPPPPVSPEEAAHFWANVDPAWAASIGLVKVDRK